ncbi:hypothetical protein GW17_00059034, partial [Ensete ventricosum]
MMSHHDLDSAVTEGSLAAIRARYSIPSEYGLYVPEPGQRPYSLDVPGMCISVDALEAGLRFPLHPLIEECLKRWRVSPNRMDLGDLRGMPRVAGGRVPPSRPSAHEARASPAREAPRMSAKRP